MASSGTQLLAVARSGSPWIAVARSGSQCLVSAIVTKALKTQVIFYFRALHMLFKEKP